VYQHLDLTIEVHAAQALPLPPGDSKASSFRPYVKVELHTEDTEHRLGRHLPAKAAAAAVAAAGSLAKEGRYKARTHTARGCDPDFKAQPLAFKAVPGVVEELTFVRFIVRDDEVGRDELAAWACVRLDRLGLGYRFVHLLDAEGVETEGVVLIKVTKKLTT